MGRSDSGLGERSSVLAVLQQLLEVFAFRMPLREGAALGVDPAGVTHYDAVPWRVPCIALLKTWISGGGLLRLSWLRCMCCAVAPRAWLPPPRTRRERIMSADRTTRRRQQIVTVRTPQ